MINLKYFNGVFFNSLKIGCNISLLPKLINRIYNFLLIRIIRVLGGFSLLVFMFGCHNNFPGFLYLVVICFTTVQITQVVFIATIKVMYSFFVLKNIVSDSNTSYSIVYITILFRVLLIVIMECVGFLGFDVIQYIEIFSGNT